MNVNRATLIAALSLASKVIPTSGRTTLLSHARLRCLPGQRLELAATSLETSLVVEMPFAGEALSTPTLAPIAWLLKLLKATTDDEVVMDRNTVNAITMYEGGPDDLKPEDFPEVPDHSSFIAAQIPGLTAAMLFAYDAASVDPQRFTLNHVQVIATKKGVTVNATDGHRLYRQQLPSAGVTVAKLIPSGLLDLCAFKKLIPTDQFAYDTKYIALRVDGQGLTGWAISKEVSGQFPNCDSVTPQDSSTVLQVALNPTDALGILKQAIAASTEARPASIDLVVRDGALFLHPTGRNIELLVPNAKPVGPDMIIGMNGHYLRGALLNLTAPVIALHAETPGKPIWFNEGRGKTRRIIVIMPMRTNYAGLVKIDGKDAAVESIQSASV